MKISLLINMKMPTIVGIFIFISREHFVLSWVEHERSFITSGSDIILIHVYEKDCWKRPLTKHATKKLLTLSTLGQFAWNGLSYFLGKIRNIWATTWESVPSDIWSKEDSNQLVHSRSLIRDIVVRMKKFCILGYPKCVQWRFWSDYANAQADLNLRLAHMSEGMFSHFVAHFFILKD